MVGTVMGTGEGEPPLLLSEGRLPQVLRVRDEPWMSLSSDPYSLNMMLNMSNDSKCQWPRVVSEALSLHTQLAASPENPLLPALNQTT